MCEDLKVLKRDNKKTAFNGEKIAIAIKKSFDSREEFIEKYTDEDINRVYLLVLEDIYDTYFEKPYIKVEEIQDVIEKQLLKLDYKDVYESFSTYRDKRSESRKMFLSEPKQHKLLKAIEKITLKKDWISKNNESSIDIMFNYGKTISEEFANAFLINSKYSNAHESGRIYISDVDFVPMGTTESCVIDFNKLIEKGFNVDKNFHKKPDDISSYLDLLSLIIRKNSEDTHGEQGLQNFDYYLEGAVLETFKEELKNKIFEFLSLNGFSNFVDLDYIARDVFKIERMSFDMRNLYKHSKGVNQIENILDIAYNKALESTNKIVSKSIHNFLHNSYFKIGNHVRDLTINLGTSTSLEGRMIIKNYLLSIDNSIIPKTVFKLKEGCNFNGKDPNYDLFELACSAVLDGNTIGFSFIDYSKNIKHYDGTCESEVFYFYNGTRILENIFEDNQTSIGRGILSKTYINLPRIGIKNSKLEANKSDFFEELEITLELVKDQLLERFSIQSDKKVSDFSFIVGEGIYIDSKGLKSGEKIKKSIKNGLLAIGLVGLKECIKSLNFEIQEEEILEFIFNKIKKFKKEYNLNFVLIGSNKEVSNIFIDIDRAIYGDIKDVTDKKLYDVRCLVNKENFYQNIFDGGYLIQKYIDLESISDVVKYLKSKDIGFISLKKRS